jgi:Tol biopolymer transport system component
MLSFENGAVKTRPFLQTPFFEQYAEFSPDGHWLAYVSNESGRNEVYVQPYPGPGGRQQVSTDGGDEPAWARNGREMFYMAPGTDGAIRMMAVDVALGPTFTVGKSRILFEGRNGGQVNIRGYDVTQDGRRFLMVQSKEQPPESPITEMVLVQNWFEELKQKVPTGTK